MGIMDAVGHALMDNDKLHFAKPPEPLMAEEQWLVTLSAPLSAFNGDYVDAVATGKDADTLGEGVAGMWNVHDRASFEEVAAWLAREGQRNAYAPVWQGMRAIDAAAQGTHPVLRMVFDSIFPGYYQLRARPQLDMKALAASAERPVNDLAQLFFHCREWMSDLAKRFQSPASSLTSLVAWDAVRLASLSRWAVQLGYIERAEFARFAGVLGAEVRQAYSGWPQLSAAYIVGGLIWNGSESRRDHLVRTNRLLLSDARSPYRSVPWR